MEHDTSEKYEYGWQDPRKMTPTELVEYDREQEKEDERELMVAWVNHVLDGKDDGYGVMSESMEPLRQRLLGIRRHVFKLWEIIDNNGT